MSPNLSQIFAQGSVNSAEKLWMNRVSIYEEMEMLYPLVWPKPMTLYYVMKYRPEHIFQQHCAHLSPPSALVSGGEDAQSAEVIPRFEFEFKIFYLHIM